MKIINRKYFLFLFFSTFILSAIGFIHYLAGDNYSSAVSSNSPQYYLPGYTTGSPPVYVNPLEQPAARNWILLGRNCPSGAGCGGSGSNQHCYDLSDYGIDKIRYVMMLNNSNIGGMAHGADPDGVIIKNAANSIYNNSKAQAMVWVHQAAEGTNYQCNDLNFTRKLISPLGPDLCGQTRNCGCALGKDPDVDIDSAQSGYVIWDVACSQKKPDGVYCDDMYPQDPGRLISNGPGVDFCIYEVGTSENYSLWGLDYETTEPSPTPTPTPTTAPFMLTRGGDVFSNMAVTFGGLFLQNTLGRISLLTNPNLAALDLQNRKPFLASYNFLQGDDAIISCANCSGLNSIEKNYFAGDYQDQNTTPAGGWYQFIADKLAGSDLIDETVNSLPDLSVTAQLPNNIKFKNGVGVLQVLNSLTINSGFVCATQTIFLIKDDLLISPDFTVGANDDACLFVVGGETKILAGGRKSAAGSVNYDIVKAFIITDTFTDPDDTAGGLSDGLAVIGSIIADNITFGRRVDTVEPLSPAEVISYDDRYLSIFKNVLDEAINFSIREKPYIDAINNDLL